MLKSAGIVSRLAARQADALRPASNFLETDMGPNVKRLIAHKMATDAIPANGGFADGLRFLSSAESIRNGCRAATAWVQDAIAAVKAAPDNPFGDDEAIAGEILQQIEARKAGRRAELP